VSARTVLVIDDEEPIRDTVRAILEEAGYVVFEAPDGRAGLHLLRESGGPLVVLLDLMMPGISGIGLLRAVAADPVLAGRDAYIIFSAARAFTVPTPLRYFMSGKRLFDVPKPFDIDNLVAVVEQAARQLDSERDEAEVVASGPGQLSLPDGEE
jgi:DNA-binding response OmpR family regulator